MFKALKFIGYALVIMVVAAVGFLYVSPPDLLRVGTNYTAKIVCSNVFIAGRDAEQVLEIDVQAPGHPLLKQISIDVDRETQTVTARVFQFFAPAQSQYREGLGCTNVHNTQLESAEIQRPASQAGGFWPLGDTVRLSQDPQVLDALSDETLLGEGYRAVVVVKNGRILGEQYADGFDPTTPLLGWSMTKSVTASVIGTLVKSGRLSLSDSLTSTYPDWANDGRNAITVGSMLSMTSGLEWNEGYGDVSDVTRMLFLSNDMAGFASEFASESDQGGSFKYSSGTSTMLARAWQDKVGEDSLRYPTQEIFGPLGMTSAVMETDAANTFVGSSYMYANARDWARFGLFLLRDGVWLGQEILPEGFVQMMFEPVAVSDGRYTKGHMWREVPGGGPIFEDAVWMAGHDGQSIGIFPSHDLVVVRLGLTPSKLGYSPLPLAQALIAALED